MFLFFNVLGLYVMSMCVFNHHVIIRTGGDHYDVHVDADHSPTSTCIVRLFTIGGHFTITDVANFFS